MVAPTGGHLVDTLLHYVFSYKFSIIKGYQNQGLQDIVSRFVLADLYLRLWLTL